MAIILWISALTVHLLIYSTSAELQCTFEEHPQHSLYGFNNKVVVQASLDECMLHCKDETTFNCISIDYLQETASCYLSSESHLTQPEDFGAHFRSLYLYKAACFVITTTPSPIPTQPPPTSGTPPSYDVGVADVVLHDLGFDPGRYLNVFLDLQFQARGEITRWQFFAKRAGRLVPTVWRPMGGDRYQLISRYPIGVYGSGLVDYFVEPGEFPPVEAGDLLGILYPEPVLDAEPQGSGVVPYESTNQGQPICCGILPESLSRLLNAGISDEELETGEIVTLHEVAVRRWPAMVATVTTTAV